MDTANAAAISDPNRNLHFRRRWHEDASIFVNRQDTPARAWPGTFGVALLEAFRAKQQAAAEADAELRR